ncbi:MAG: tetratricopeptide repeat protein, partial [Planctomycetales bacterium]|nr:tetratricopeptide repeat protein [Planctomycetales bacterium]
NPGQALQDLDEALRRRPWHPGTLLNRGGIRHRLGDLRGALEDLELAIRNDPDFPDPVAGAGAVREDMGDLDGAIRDYEEFLRRAPDHAQASPVRRQLSSCRARRDPLERR